MDLNLSGLTSQITDLKASLVPKYYVDPARLAGWTDLDAELNGHSNQWQVYIDPVWVNVALIDVPATIDNILVNAITNAIDNLFPSWLPGWAVDIIMAFLGPIVDLITDLLGITTSIAEWLSNLLSNVFGLVGFVGNCNCGLFRQQVSALSIRGSRSQSLKQAGDSFRSRFLFGIWPRPSTHKK